MIRITSLRELDELSLSSPILIALKKALQTEHEIARPNSYDPDDQGSLWLMQSSDTDNTLVETFGAPLNQLLFEKVCHDPDDRFFICYLVRNNSCCDTLIIPDVDWLDRDWRLWLISQQ